MVEGGDSPRKHLEKGREVAKMEEELVVDSTTKVGGGSVENEADEEIDEVRKKRGRSRGHQ